MLRLSLSLMLLGGGCRYEVDIADVQTLPDDYAVAFNLADAVTVAGEAVPYELVVTNRGEVVDAVEWTLVSDLESYVAYDTAAITPTIAGDHTVSAFVQVDGYTTVVDAALSVQAAIAHDLDLRVSDTALLAGGSLDYRVLAIDRYGNEVDADLSDVTADSADLLVDVDTKTLSGTLPGTFLVTASLEGLDDAEVVVVEGGPPAALRLTLVPHWPGLRETGSATVEVSDAYGNAVWAPWVLATDRPSDTVVSGRNVTFYAEGWHTVTATVPGTPLSASEGPFLIDDTGPSIAVEWPGRGEWTTAVNEAVRGAVTDAWSSISLTVQGSPAEVAADGTYSVPIALPWGVTVVQTEATDGNGNVSNDTRAVLSGEFLPYGDQVPGGIEARLSEGVGGLGTLESIGENLIDSQDIAGIIPNPVFSDSSQSCWRVCLPWPFDSTCWEDCITWYSINLNVNNPSIGASDLQIDPRADHTVLLRGVIASPTVPWSASGRALGVGYSASGAITADSAVVDIVVLPRVAGGQLTLDLVSVDTTLHNFNFNFDGTLWDILSFFGVDNLVNGLIRTPLEDAISGAVRDQVPPVVAQALNQLELSYDFPLGARTLSLDAAPSGVGVDDTGITLGLGTSLTVDQVVHADPGLGSLYGGFGAPHYPASPHMNLAFSADFLNQAAYAAWLGGLLDIDDSLSGVGLPAAELQTFLPGVQSLDLRVNPLLPPVIVPGTGPETYDLQIGDMGITLYDGVTGETLIEVYVTAVAGLEVGNNGDVSLTATVGNMDLWFDVTVPDGNTAAAGDTEALLGALLPLILPRITDVLNQIDVPSFSGFQLSNLTTGAAGEQGAWFVLGGDLVVQ